MHLNRAGVHPAGGNVLCYFELAQQLGRDQPFYGIQAFGLEAKQPPYQQVSDMATFYVDALQTIQPHGPYFVAGWLFGGLVAFEMVRQLQAQGESIALLALLDTIVPSIIKEHQQPEDDAELLFELLREEEISLSLEQLRQMAADEQLSYVIEQGKQVGLFPPDVDVAQSKRLLQVYKINAELAQSYQPSLYQGQIMLFKAVVQSEEMPITKPDYGWGAYATKSVEIIEVPGNHQNMVKSPQVQTLAEQLKCYLK